MLVAAILVIAAIAAWFLAAEKARGAIEVGLEKPIECTGTTVTSRRLGEEVGGSVSIITLAKRMRCTMRVGIVNKGSLPVRLGTASFPVLGPGGGPGIRMTGAGMRPRGVDAVFAIDRVLEPGESMQASYVLRFRPQGCDGPGAVSWIETAPDLNVSALWLSGHQHGDATVAWRGTTDSSCD